MKPHNFSSHSNMETSFAKKVLRKIDDEHIVPRPRWIFLLRNRLLWAFAFLAVLVASVATAAVLFVLVHMDWQHALITHKTWMGFLMDALPFMWFGILVLFSAIGYAHIRITSYGYRYPLIFSIIGIIVAVCGLGIVFFMSGLGRVLEENAHTYLPWYESVLYEKQSWLDNQYDGLLLDAIAMEYKTDSLGARQFYHRINKQDAKDGCIRGKASRVRMVAFRNEVACPKV